MTTVNEIYNHHLVDRRWATTFLGTGQRIRTLFLGIKIGAVAEETRAKLWTLTLWATSACLLRRSTKTRVCRSDSCRLFNFS